MRGLVGLIAVALSGCLPGEFPVPGPDIDGDGYTVGDGDCDDNDADLSPVTEWFADGDGDGFGGGGGTPSCTQPVGRVADSSDCDDDDKDAFPGAVEVCNGSDDDCDGAKDDNASGGTNWYADVDKDGFGDDADVVVSCPAVTGRIEAGGDCDDDDKTVSPDGIETCNDLDDDCDKSVDEAESTDATDWYLDEDGDGFGDGTATRACDAPSSKHVDDDTDCDDKDDKYHPGADEDCADPLDYNCDGSTGFADLDSDGSPACDDCNDNDAGISPDDLEICDPANVDENCDTKADDADSTATGKTKWYADADKDTYGAPVSEVVACDAPTDHVSDDSDCDDTNKDISPAAAELCDALDADEDCDTFADDLDLDDDPGTLFYADVDKDGHGDEDDAVGAKYCDPPNTVAASKDDCDDASKDISPSDPEICDAGSVDEDCDTLADDADSNVLDAGRADYYADLDKDSFGDGTSLRRCDPVTLRVTNDTDCDDADDTVYPGAIELCDAQANECATAVSWVAADEDGLVTYFPVTGAPVDRSVTWGTGTGTSATSLTLPLDGEIAVCAGTYFVELTVPASADVSVVGIGAAVLSGDGTGRVIDAPNAGARLLLADLDVEGGGAVAAGGGLRSTGALLTLDRVDVHDNKADMGGGIALIGGTLTATGCDVYANTSTVSSGGGVYASAGATANFSGGEIRDNTATLTGGGLALEADTTSAVTFDLTVGTKMSGNSSSTGGAAISIAAPAGNATVLLDTGEISSNLSAGNGGGVRLVGGTGRATFQCDGAAVVTNSALDGGGAFVSGTTTIDATSCDFGTGATDNAPSDISNSGGVIGTYGAGATFVCTDGVCL